MYQASPLPEKFAQFLAHWQALRIDGQLPTLADFLDKPVPALQPWISIFDVERNHLPLRLFGTAMVKFSGNDHTGKMLSDISVTEGHVALLKLNHQVAQKCCGSVTGVHCATSAGRDLELWVMGLPLARKDGISVAWLNETPVNLGLAEIGLVIRGIIAQQWLDLGYGVPEKS